MANFVFSDPHFYSQNIIINCHRPFNTVEEMNATIIRNYNDTVRKQDVCYWLGDVMYGATHDRIQQILRKLHGRKYLILGNHDRGHSAKWWEKAGFDKVFEHPVYDASQYIMLSHEPLPEFANADCVVNYHGHIHIQPYPFPDHSHHINVCVEKTDYRPVPLYNPFINSVRRFER